MNDPVLDALGEPPDPFVGRSAELAAVAGAFAAGQRLVTVLGPAGIGKTRLALRFARGGARRRPVVTVALADARSLGEVCAAVERAVASSPDLDRGEADLDSVERHVAHLGSVLVLLDNAEHVAPAVAELVGRCLACAPRARFVVTSRARLGVAGECAVELGPLAVPLGDAPSAVDVLGCEAGQLLVVRARAIRTDFAIRDDEAPAVAELLRRLDGVPLAIELCAARLRVLGPVQLLAHVRTTLDALGRRGDGPARQATLRDAISWSWELLSVCEQRALARCAVFRGGFDLPGAAAVLVDAAADAPALAAKLLEALRDQSLVVVGPSPLAGEVRYRLLEGVRELAAERLAESGDGPEAARRHAEHFCRHVERWSEELAGPRSAAAWRRLCLDTDNVLVGVERSLAHDASPAAVCRALVALSALEPVVVVGGRAPLSPFVALLDAALDGARDQPPSIVARGRATRTLALLALGRLDVAYLELVALWEFANGNQVLDVAVLCTTMLGVLHTYAGDSSGAASRFEEAERTAQSLGDARIAGRVALARGAACTWGADAALAARHYGAAAERFRAASDPLQESIALGQLGLALLNLGRYEAAEDASRRALVRVPDGQRRIEAHAQAVLGRVLATRGRLDEGRALLESALAVYRSGGAVWGQAFHLGLLGTVAFEQGRFGEARQRFEDAVALMDELCSSARRRAVAAARRVDATYAAIFRARLGAVEAELGQLEAAEASLLAAEGALEADEHVATAVVRVCRGHVDVARTRAAVACGDRPTGALHAAAARQRLAVAEQAAFGATLGSISEEVRVAKRLLEASLARAGDLPTEPPSQSPEATRLVVGHEARWFEVGEHRVELARGRAQRLVLERLVDHRLAAPGAALGLDALFEAGWPGERARPQSAKNRVYVTLTKLRNLGLRGVVQSRDDGFLLDPRVEVVRATGTW